MATRRRLGNSDLMVSPLCFGGNVFGWTADAPTSFRLLDAYVAAGLNFIDTADVYSKWIPGNKGGESETIIGQWLKRSGKRRQVVIASKVGKEMGPGRNGLAKSYILRAVEDSLRRLQTDAIDLYQSHIDDEQTPLEETLEAYAHLIKQGKVRAIGASNYRAERLAQSLQLSRERGLPAYQCLQPQYNLCDRAEYEAGLEPLCRKMNIGVISYYSLASGFLSGKYRSQADACKSARGGGIVKKYVNERGLRILAALDSVARETGSNPTRIALAWLIARPGITAPIVSATSLDQLHDLIEATRLELEPSSIELLDRASA